MYWPRSPKRFSIILLQWRTRFACSSLLLLAGIPARAQTQEAVVEALAGVLAGEDARRYDGPLFRAAARHAHPVVRRHAALALGRIGNRAATPALLDLLSDPDTTVQADAAFALGLLGDPAAIPRLGDLVLNPPETVSPGTQTEAVSALARIGGAEVARLYADIFARAIPLAGAPQVPPFIRRALGESWRLGADAPVARLTLFAASPDAEARWRAVYSLARLHPVAAADVLLAAASDSSPLIRATVARELTAAFADSARIDRAAMSARVRRLASDPDAPVRIAALRALATYRNAELSPVAIERASDPDPNVRIQALATLGDLGGAPAVAALRERLESGSYAIRRQALLSLIRLTSAVPLATWISDPDWRIRALAAEALGAFNTDSSNLLLESLMRSPDGRVAAAALGSLVAADSLRAGRLARPLLAHKDPGVRAVAAGAVAAAPVPADLPLLVEGYARSAGDPVPDARNAMIRALGRLAAIHREGAAAIADAVVRRFPKGRDYISRRAAEREFPALAERWGEAFPAETGLEAGDYREIARRLVWPAEHDGILPRLIIETDRGAVSLSLFAGDAPLTTHALLRLVEQRYFDGGTWHRVVPGFVAQAGDPRGDGSGGPGFSLRDEPSRRGYATGAVGMALDGPDTGGSQFFITLAPQPHLEGIYTVFARVDSGMDFLGLVVQGDRIRSIRAR